MNGGEVGLRIRLALGTVGLMPLAALDDEVDLKDMIYWSKTTIYQDRLRQKKETDLRD